MRDKNKPICKKKEAWKDFETKEYKVIFSKFRNYVDTNRNSIVFKILSPIKEYVHKRYHKYDAFYFPELKAVYYHSLKCEGTSILYALKSKYKCIQMRNNDAKKLNCFNFTITRNPYSRMVSCYNFLVGSPSFDKKYNTYKGMNFEEFVTIICNVKNRDSNEHFQSLSAHHNIGGLNYFNFIGKLENINKDFDRLCEIIGIEKIQIPHINKTKHKSWEDYYNKELREIVYKRYKNDFTFGNYKK